MKQTKGLNISALLAILLTLAIFLPDLVKFEHFSGSHEHEICTDHDTIHLHSLHLDCKLLHCKTTTPLTLTTFTYSLVAPEEHKAEDMNFYYFQSEYQQLHFNLRAPPFFFISTSNR
ncbi:hypothetical protein DMZ48_06155 [Robertkochia solimangrovi]|nr:hypothetical protein DMZ48_06155 [Robertkochia solimangrovi]